MKDIYIDFDRTIYNTDKLYKDMDNVIKKYGIKKERFKEVEKIIFKEPILFNYISVIKYICDKDGISKKVIEELKKILLRGDTYIYEDTYDFIKKYKNEGYIIHILTYGDLNFQLMKLSNLSVCDIINSIFVTQNYKFDLDLNYSNSIFIDDNPRDLIGLFNNNARIVIRIKRDGLKYSDSKLENNKISVCKNLKEIDLKACFHERKD